MSDPTDDLRNYEEALWDEVRRDIRDRENKGIEQYGKTVTDSTPIVGVDEAYEEVLDAVVYVKHAQRAYKRLNLELEGVKRELEYLKSLESYKAQEARIQELEATNRALAERTRSLEMNLPTARVEALELLLRIARKANHLEDLQAAERRIIELEQKLEELNG